MVVNCSQYPEFYKNILFTTHITRYHLSYCGLDRITLRLYSAHHLSENLLAIEDSYFNYIYFWFDVW